MCQGSEAYNHTHFEWDISFNVFIYILCLVAATRCNVSSTATDRYNYLVSDIGTGKVDCYIDYSAVTQIAFKILLVVLNGAHERSLHIRVPCT